MQYLEQVIREKEMELADVPAGTLHIGIADGRVQYYLYENGRRSYIREQETELIKELCQKDYDQKVLRSAQKELGQLKKLQRIYESTTQETNCEKLYEKMAKERQKLIIPVRCTDEEYRKQWESIAYEKKGFGEQGPEFYTDKGERVRSKSEILIANALEKHHIPYRYECPLFLNDYGLIHPDFTILNVRKRKEIYLEHMGLMDNEEYRESALKRITAYEKNGIFPGDRLVLTHETSRNPLDSRLLEILIKQYFI